MAERPSLDEPAPIRSRHSRATAGIISTKAGIQASRQALLDSCFRGNDLKDKPLSKCAVHTGSPLAPRADVCLLCATAFPFAAVGSILDIHLSDSCLWY